MLNLHACFNYVCIVMQHVKIHHLKHNFTCTQSALNAYSVQKLWKKWVGSGKKKKLRQHMRENIASYGNIHN